MLPMVARDGCKAAKALGFAGDDCGQTIHHNIAEYGFTHLVGILPGKNRLGTDPGQPVGAGFQPDQCILLAVLAEKTPAWIQADLRP